jgi:dissimilatory sulfite reductase (desulfoviridin) alpha/beta subunit
MGDKEKEIRIDRNLEEGKRGVVLIDARIEDKSGPMDFQELKSGGFIKQRQRDLFTVRLRCPGGRISLKRLKKICEVAEKYAGDYIHLSVRQSLELPYVNYRHFDKLIKELGEVEQHVASCGPRVRVPTACSGCEYNPNGLTDTQKMAQMVNELFFGIRCPHKFKISFSGCPIDCARTSEMDLGFQGAVLPVWDEGSCTGCTLCAFACLEGAITADPAQGRPIFHPSNCLYCSDCIRTCPTGAWKVGRRGHIVRIGGKHGRHPLKGSNIARFIPDEDVPKVIERVLEWYNKVGQGKGRTRIGQLLREPGRMGDLIQYLAPILGDNAIKNPQPPEPVPINRFPDQEER